MKKEKQKNGSQTVFWWVAWITLTIGSFFLASAVWTPVIAKRFGSIHESRNAVIWVIAVFGSWMVILLPLMIVMYQKVDKAYEDARIRREKAAQRFRSIAVDRTRRLLPATLSAKLKNWPETIQGGHLVHVTLRDGRKFQNVFIQNREEILGIYDAADFPFEGKDVAELEAADQGKLPAFLMASWLRLDGIKAET